MRVRRKVWVLFLGVLLAVAGAAPGRLLAQESALPPPRVALSLPAAPPVEPADRPLAISLLTAMHLANVQAVDIAAAAERIKIALAALELAKVQWLPTITLGGD